MGNNYLTAFDVDQLHGIIDSNKNAPTIGRDETERLVELAQQRADARGEQNALDDTQTDCLIITEWEGYAANEFGYDNGTLNTMAIGILESEVSAGKGATLFTDTAVIQSGWLHSGDGRRASVEAYMDDDFEKADEGDCWIPNGAQDYMCIVELSDELVHGEITLEDAA